MKGGKEMKKNYQMKFRGKRNYEDHVEACQELGEKRQERRKRNCYCWIPKRSSSYDRKIPSFI